MPKFILKELDKECERCGAAFKTKSHRAKYCSGLCKKRDMRERKRQALLETEEVVVPVEVPPSPDLGMTVTRVVGKGQCFYLPCEVAKAARIYGDEFSYSRIENYVRS